MLHVLRTSKQVETKGRKGKEETMQKRDESRGKKRDESKRKRRGYCNFTNFRCVKISVASNHGVFV